MGAIIPSVVPLVRAAATSSRLPAVSPHEPHKVFRAPRINDEQAVIVDYRGYSMRDPSELGKGHYRGP
jgi:hypothetical protein